LTEAAQIADRWKGYCEDLYQDKEGKRIEQEYWEQEPPPLRSDVARAIHQTASRKATGPIRTAIFMYLHFFACIVFYSPLFYHTLSKL